MRSLLTVLLLSVLAVDARSQDAAIDTAGTKSEQAKDSKFQFDGEWKPKGAMLSGVLLPPPAIRGITLKIDGNQYEVTVVGENHSDKGTFTIDETVTPKRMSINSLSGPNKGKTILAIFEVKNADAMRVCYDLSGKDYPKEFKAPKDTELYLVGYRRRTEHQSAHQPLVIGNRQEPTDSQACALAKSFCVAMRRHHSDENVSSLRHYFDPRYLEQNDLLDGELRIQMVPVDGIENIQLADDNRSVLCHFQTDAGQSEVILLRTVVHSGCLYLSPILAPDKSTKVFTPWILRMPL